MHRNSDIYNRISDIYISDIRYLCLGYRILWFEYTYINTFLRNTESKKRWSRCCTNGFRMPWPLRIQRNIPSWTNIREKRREIGQKLYEIWVCVLFLSFLCRCYFCCAFLVTFFWPRFQQGDDNGAIEDCDRAAAEEPSWAYARPFKKTRRPISDKFLTNLVLGGFSLYLHNLVYWVGFGTAMASKTH